MKKNTLMILAFMIITAVTAAVFLKTGSVRKTEFKKRKSYEEAQSEKEKEILKKFRIRSKTASKSEYRSGEVSLVYKNMFFEFDTEADLIRSTIYEAGGSSTVWDYVYDEKKDNIRTKAATNAGKQLADTVYKYDENKNVIEENDLVSTGQPERRTYAFDASGNKISETHYSTGGVALAKYFEYDANNNRAAEKNASGEVTLKCRYDANNNKIEDAYILPGGKTSIFSYKFDEKNLLSETLIYSSGGELSDRFNYRYDGNSNMTEIKRSGGDGKLMARETYKYDERELLSEQAAFDANDRIESVHKYEYSE